MSKWTRLSDLADKLNTKTKSVLVVRPTFRPYISRDGVIYDYTVGHEFTVADQSSPLNNCRVTVCDRHTLKKSYGLTHLQIKFNPGMAPVEVAL